MQVKLSHVMFACLHYFQCGLLDGEPDGMRQAQAGWLGLLTHAVSQQRDDTLLHSILPEYQEIFRPSFKVYYLQGELEKLPAMGAPPPQLAPPAGRKPKPVLLE